MKTAAPCYYHLEVDVTPDRIDQIRRILSAHLRYWNLESHADSVCHCTDALLHTIARHAVDKHTTVEMWWNGQHLITAVQDGERDIQPHSAPSGCLVQIAALSDGWGCCATANGGKIIWFSRRARAAERAPLVPTAPTPTLSTALGVPRTLPVPALAFSEEVPMEVRA
jgi:hypothetical protein